MRFWVGLGVVIFVFAAACKGGGKRDIRDFYFPVEDLRKGQVYEYDLAQGDSSSPEYWYFRAFQRDSGLFLAGTFYNERFEIGQIIRIKIADEGVVARSYSIYDADFETGKQMQTNATIESADVFPFKVKESAGVSVFSLKYHPAGDSDVTIHLKRSRIFLGNAPDFEFNGELYPCVRFGVTEEIGMGKFGKGKLSGSGEEWYAKGLGLVYYRKTISGKKAKVSFGYRLKDIFPMSEFEKRAAAFFGE